MTVRTSVTVLMPVLNEEQAVARAVASVLAQAGDELDVHVVVVDGPSTDATSRIVEDLAASDPRVTLLRNPLRNIPAGLNIGLAAARGEFVARVDGHASVSADYLARAVAHLRSDPGLAGVGGTRVGVARTREGASVALALSSPFGVGNSINHFGTEFTETDHASFGVYRAEVAREVGGWDENLPVNEDVDFDHRILAAGHRIAYDPAMRIYWHVRESIPALFFQYRRYGRGKAMMVRKNGRTAIRSRHLVAPAAVVGTAALGVVATRAPRLAVGLYSPYVAGVLGASAHAWRRRNAMEHEPGSSPTPPPRVAAIPAAFVAMHYGWGLGFLESSLLGLAPANASSRTASA